MHPSYHDVVASLRTERIAASEEEERVQEGLDGGWQDTLSLTDLFAAHALTKDARFENSVTLANAHSRYKLAESAYFGVVLNHERERVFLNTHEPFCAVVVGVQGAGKSHSMSVILESCLLSSAALSNEQDTTLITARQPMCALVLHYDQNPSSLCEATGLISPATFKGLNGDVPALPPDNMTVLTSPTFYLQRREFYDGYCDVRPLLFSWDNLSADHIKKLMRIDDNENLLYVATLMALLRKYQRIGQKPSFSDFKREVVALSNIKSQEAPLMQRLNILESFLLESKINEHIRNPLFTNTEVNSVFQLLVEQFRVAPLERGGKVVALDEVHKFMDGTKADGLSHALLATIRLMRHDGIRVVLSTQSPCVLPPEVLELVSVAFLHRFHSRDWFGHLKSKIPLRECDYEHITKLNPGEAVVFVGRHLLDTTDEVAGVGAGSTFKVGTRPRFTADRGASRLNL